MRLILC